MTNQSIVLASAAFEDVSTRLRELPDCRADTGFMNLDWMSGIVVASGYRVGSGRHVSSANVLDLQ